MATGTDNPASTSPTQLDIDSATMRTRLLQIEIWLGLFDENLDSPAPDPHKLLEYAEIIRTQLKGINRQHTDASDDTLKQRIEAVFLRLESSVRRAAPVFNDPNHLPATGNGNSAPAPPAPLHNQPPAPPNGPVDNGRAGGDDGRMNERITALEKSAEKAVERLGKIEQDVAVIRAGMSTKDDLAKVAQDVAVIRSNLPNFSTKEDLRGLKEDVHKELHGMTWKIIRVMGGLCAALVAATFFIAKNVAPFPGQPATQAAPAMVAPIPSAAPLTPTPTGK